MWLRSSMRPSSRINRGVEFNLFSSAGIPYFAGEGVSPAELTSPNSYPLASGAPVGRRDDPGIEEGWRQQSLGIYAGANIAPEQYAVSQVEAAMMGLESPLTMLLCTVTRRPTRRSLRLRPRSRPEASTGSSCCPSTQF